MRFWLPQLGVAHPVEGVELPSGGPGIDQHRGVPQPSVWFGSCKLQLPGLSPLTDGRCALATAPGRGEAEQREQRLRVRHLGLRESLGGLGENTERQPAPMLRTAAPGRKRT